MERLKIDVDIMDFWSNWCSLKSNLSIPLPIDSIQFQCCCKEKLTMFHNGDYFLEPSSEISVTKLIVDLKDKLVLEHFAKGVCQKCILKIDESVGHPDVLIFFINPDVNGLSMEPFLLEDIQYTAKLCVYNKEDIPVMVMFQQQHSIDTTYFKMITRNFQGFLNVHQSEHEESEHENFDMDKISDDETALLHQQSLPRLKGGGRKMLQDFKYVCKWCSEETLKQKTKGRFREIKNYRDHFRRVHQDLPFSEFLNKVDRDEPKFHCKICNKKISLGNQLRHQVICRPEPCMEQSSSDSSSSSSDEEEKVQRSITKKGKHDTHDKLTKVTERTAK